MINYKAWVRDEEVRLLGKTRSSLIKNLRKVAAVDLRKHYTRTLFSEINVDLIGIFFLQKDGQIVAGIEFEGEEDI